MEIWGKNEESRPFAHLGLLRLATPQVGRLEAVFSGQSEVYLAQLLGRQRLPQESVQDFAQAIRKPTDDAYVGMAEEARNRIARDNFMGNLRDREIRSAVHLSRPTSMEEAIRTALETEAFLTAEKQKNPAKYTRVVHNDGSEKDAKMTEMLDLLKELVSQVSQKDSTAPIGNNRNRSGVEDGRRYERRSWRRNRKNPGDRGCFECGSFDHFIADCPERKDNGARSEMITRRETTCDPTKEPGAGRRQTNWLWIKNTEWSWWAR